MFDPEKLYVIPGDKLKRLEALQRRLLHERYPFQGDSRLEWGTWLRDEFLKETEELK